MSELLGTFFGELSRNIRMADILDIFLAGTFLFAIITWLRRDISRRALKGLGAVVVGFIGLYTLARVLGLYLIGLFIEVLFLVFLIGTVVVFQSDIRRLIDRTTSWNILRGGRRSSVREETLDVFTEALEEMAARRTGALIALKGREAWEHHLHGGIELDGAVSQPLIYSLFNPNSPAHDGAVLVEDNKITKFAVHLPLSTRLPNDSEYGTRHAAALGLAERTDALVLVVSEERGEISVAEGGSLGTVNTLGDLKRRLEQFWARHTEDRARRQPHVWFFQNMRTASLSFALAATLWLLFVYSPNILYRPFEVPIVYQNLPTEWVLAESVPQEARIALYGPQRAFQDFDPRNLMVVVDMGSPKEGLNRKVLSPSSLELPARISLAEIDPAEVEVEVWRLQPRRLPVRAATTGELGPNLDLGRVSVEPDSLTILVPVQGDEIPNVLQTEPVDLSRITESTTLARSVVIPSNAKLAPETVSEAEIRVEVTEKQGISESSGTSAAPVSRNAER